MPKAHEAKVGDESRFNKIGQTAWLTAHWRTFSDIPLSREVFAELENVRRESGALSIPNELKDNTRIAVQLEARYKLVDQLLQNERTDQVLEVAAGMSTRGLNIANYYKEYVEFDLPAMITEKQGVIRKLEEKGVVQPSPALRLVGGNALNLADLEHAVSFLDPNKTIVIVNEGLMRYLNFDEKAAYATNVKAILSKFGGTWITPDVTLRHVLSKEDEIRRQHTQRVSTLTGVDIQANRFENEQQTKEFFEKFGFSVERHPLTEELPNLVSPKALNLSAADAEDSLAYAVAFVMKLV